MIQTKLRGWNDWYGFARDVLGYGGQESTLYANMRYVEEQNRASDLTFKIARALDRDGRGRTLPEKPTPSS